jgi:hypothetical protein
MKWPPGQAQTLGISSAGSGDEGEKRKKSLEEGLCRDVLSQSTIRARGQGLGNMSGNPPVGRNRADLVSVPRADALGAGPNGGRRDHHLWTGSLFERQIIRGAASAARR